MRKIAWFVPVLLALALPAAGCDPGAPARGRRDGATPGEDAGGPLLPDADGDGIPDQYEGRATNVDTDGDGTPDYLDDDSDGDTVPDAAEGQRPNGMPVDTDGDGTADFRDLDSDGNSIPDSVEGADDLDGDRAPNSGDLDNDGDNIPDVLEIGGSPSSPIDADRDLAPDYSDPDSDNDTIADLDESTLDTDMDGMPDRWDEDTDGDGISDADEAGDTDFSSPPFDTDMDRTPDFRDTDSDADGLSDAQEHTAGSNPLAADTDGDGVTDLVEVASGTGVTDPADNPRAHGNFVFLEPYQAAPSPDRDTLDFATDIRVADVYFLIDTTGSMQGSIDNVRNSLSAAGGIIEQVRSTISEAWFGVGDFKDFGDAYVFQHRADISADPAVAQAGVNGLFAGGGGDDPEGDVPALWTVATGSGRSGCPAGTTGYPCFRSTAVPIVVLITDVAFHNGPGGSRPYAGYTDYATMSAAVQAARIRVIGVGVTPSPPGASPIPDLPAIALDSGAVDAAGNALVTTANDGSVSTTVVNQIQTLAAATSLAVAVQYQDDASDTVDTFAAFVAYIEARQAGDPGRGCAAASAHDTNGDGHADTFDNVRAGTRVCFDIVVKQNDTVMPTTQPQLLRATLQVVGDGFTPLGTPRDVFFLVPPIIPPANCPDC